MNNYIEQFYKLKCHNDILDSTGEINNLDKEITEVMSVIKVLKKLIKPKELSKYEVVDLCAGNGLLGSTVAHLFKPKTVTCWDIYERKNASFNDVRNFKYRIGDISALDAPYFYNKIILSIHPCKTATTVIDKFTQSYAKAVILMPCCVGKLDEYPALIRENLDIYETWCFGLYNRIYVNRVIDDYNAVSLPITNIKTKRDRKCLSPKNILIYAIRG